MATLDREALRRDGFCIVPSVVTPAACRAARRAACCATRRAAYRAACRAIAAAIAATIGPATALLCTSEQRRHLRRFLDGLGHAHLYRPLPIQIEAAGGAARRVVKVA